MANAASDPEEVEPPGSRELVAEGGDDLFLRGGKAFAPERQRARVVQTQVLDVGHRHPRWCQHSRRHLREGRGVGAGKDPTANPRVQWPLNVATDEVQEPTSTVATNGPSQHGREAGEVTTSDVFQHTDRDERIERARRIPVVVVDELDSMGQALAGGARSRVVELFARDIERGDANTVVTSHVQREGTQPQPASHTVSPGFNRSFRQTRLSFARCAASSGIVRSGKYAQV